MLRVVFLGAGGALSCRSLVGVSRHHRVLGVVESASRTGFAAFSIGGLRDVARRLRGRRSELARIASDLSVPCWPAAGRGDARLARRLRQLEPDIICIAGYRWVLPPEVYTIPRLGSINLHTSLLPRHRGPMPLFWLYPHDDREAGVTVHWVAERADAGDIILQEVFPLARGDSIVRVHDQSAGRGAELMTAALDAIEGGIDRRIPQDERLATEEPVFRPGTPIANFADWDVERVWHVLAGLHPLFREPLTDRAGSPLCYEAVLGFERVEHAERPGLVVDARGRGDQYELYCRGGVVRLGRKGNSP